VNIPVQPLTPSQSESIKARAAAFPESAFDFVREGLGHTVSAMFTQAAGSGAQSGLGSLKRPKRSAATDGPQGDIAAAAQHVSGQQLCAGLRHLAHLKYGDLAGAVLQHWGVASTDDFGVMVYAMIDRGELRSSDQDRFSDFHNVYSFETTFPLLVETKRMRIAIAKHIGQRVDGLA